MTSREDLNENAALWRDDPTPPAGVRQTLTIGGAAYGFRLFSASY